MIFSTTLTLAVFVIFFHLTNASAEQSDDNIVENPGRIRRRVTTLTSDYQENDASRSLQLASTDTKVEFYLYNAETNTLMTKMNEGFVANLKSWGITNATQLNIEARVSGSVKAYSARFRLDNGIIDTIDGGDLKLLCGNAGLDVQMCPKMTNGKHTLSVTPYTGGSATGEAMGLFNINFEIIDGNIIPKPPTKAPIGGVQMPIVTYTLYNTVTNTKIVDLTNDMVVDLSLLNIKDPTLLNIQTTFKGSNTPSSVKYELNGDQHVSTDGGSIMSMCGNNGPLFHACSKLTYGKQSLVLTLFAMGSVIGQTRLNFVLSKGSTPVAVPSAVPRSMPAIIPTSPSTIPDFQLILIDTDKDIKIMDMTEGMIINLAALNLKKPVPLTIEAVYTKSKARTIKFSLNNGAYLHTDGGARQFMCGNSATDYFPCPSLSTGKYKLETTAYGDGQTLGAYSISFEIVDGIVTPVSKPLAVPSMAPVRLPPPPIAGVSCRVPKLTGSWEQVAPYPLPIAESMGALLGNDFVVFSGFDGNFETVTKKVYALNTTDPNAVWRERDEVPTAEGFSHSAYAVDGSKMYICGAYVGPSPGPDTDICLKYDHSLPSGTQWSFLPKLPGGRGGGGMFFMKKTNSLLFASGAIRRDGDWKDYNSAWELRLEDVAAGWKPMPDTLYAANHIGHVTAKYNGQSRYFILGGQKAWDEGDGNVADNMEWDNNSRQWIKRRSMPYARGHISASTIPYGCGFFIAGGSLNNSSRTADITYYGIDTDSFQSVGNLTQEVNTPVCDIVYLKSGTYMYCMTGPFWKGFSYRIRIE